MQRQAMKFDNVKVYCYTSPSNKKYIGITKNDLKERAGKEGKGYKSCTAFYKAIQKYGFDSFAVIILEDGLSYEEAYEKEKFYIKLFDTTNPEKGYNISLGGDAPFLGRHHTEETKKKLSEAISGEKGYYYGKHLAEETKEKIRQTFKEKNINVGMNNPMAGKHHTEETKEKIRQTFKERKVSVGKNNPNYGKTGVKNSLSIPIYCIKNGEKIFYDGVKEASRITKIPSSNISRSLTSYGKFSAGKDD
jgi:group I intron endonuclease